MEQEKLTALIQKILTDPRILELLQNSIGDGGSVGISKSAMEHSVLNAAETRAALDQVPPMWNGSRYCQEFPDGCPGCHDALSLEKAAAGSWNLIRVYKPSLNFIAKLATGVADEPLLGLIQQKLAAENCRIELTELSSIETIESAPYRKLFEGHLTTLRSFGISVQSRSSQMVTAASAPMINGVVAPTSTQPGTKPGLTASAPALWTYRALTERDLLDVEKGTVLTIGRKCIVTSLAADMARRKSIRICREGEGQ
ncbi:MAG: Flavoprotein [Bacillota bacterium]|nr:Flavoprotein [Bacillota bacterium]